MASREVVVVTATKLVSLSVTWPCGMAVDVFPSSCLEAGGFLGSCRSQPVFFHYSAFSVQQLASLQVTHGPLTG